MINHERLIIVPPDDAIAQDVPAYRAWCEADWTLASARPDLDPAQTRTPDSQRSREMASPLAMFGINTPPRSRPADTSLEDEHTEEVGRTPSATTQQ